MSMVSALVYSVSLYTTMAVHTTFVFIFLCLGILFARPDRGLIAVIMSEQWGGQMARLVLPLALTLPLFIGWLRLNGERAGFYGMEFGLSIFAASNIIIFTTLVWLSAKSLNHAQASWRERESSTASLARRDAADSVDGQNRMVIFRLV